MLFEGSLVYRIERQTCKERILQKMQDFFRKKVFHHSNIHKMSKNAKTILSEKQGVLVFGNDVDVHAPADDFHRLEIVC